MLARESARSPSGTAGGSIGRRSVTRQACTSGASSASTAIASAGVALGPQRDERRDGASLGVARAESHRRCHGLVVDVELEPAHPGRGESLAKVRIVKGWTGAVEGEDQFRHAMQSSGFAPVLQ